MTDAASVKEPLVARRADQCHGGAAERSARFHLQARPSLLPHFIIVGAPKCGTTALFEYLKTHPKLAASTVKEPHFWGPDVRVKVSVRDPEVYAGLWRDAPAGALRFEASPAYIFSKQAVPNILEANPEARLIAMVRHPVEMVASFHGQLVRNLHEDVADLGEAWALQETRRRGDQIPPRCPLPERLQYKEVCALGDQLERFFATVPSGQRHVIVFDDLRANPRKAYLEVLQFLGVEDDGRSSFPVENRAVSLRWPFFRALYRDARRFGAKLPRPIRRPLDRTFDPVAKALQPLNVRSKSWDPIPAELRRELLDVFKPQVEKMEKLLGRDLSSWKV
jgi:hypothetical protein